MMDVPLVLSFFYPQTFPYFQENLTIRSKGAGALMAFFFYFGDRPYCLVPSFFFFFSFASLLIEAVEPSAFV